MEDIASVLISCLKKLKTLVFSHQIQKYGQEVQQIQWQDELGRLRVWSANIGAHQTGRLSLDYRLREASHIIIQTLRILRRLERTLEDLQSMIDEPAVPGEISESDEGFQETEAQLIYNELHDTITNLFQISMAIRRPSHHDRISGTKRMDAVGYEPFDIQHASKRFPDASPGVIRRLGLAISQRRAILCYRERHSKEFGQGLDKAVDDQSETQPEKLSDALSSDLVQDKSISVNMDHILIDDESTYAQSLLHSNDEIGVPPAPPASKNGAPFQCPYCYRVISVANERKWARHVFRDLMPYMCIFSECTTSQHLYESRQEWYSHLQSQHSIGVDTEDRTSCPLCASSMAAGRQLERHLGRHLEELALFALPRQSLEAEDLNTSQMYPERAALPGPKSTTEVESLNSDDLSKGKDVNAINSASQISETTNTSKLSQTEETENLRNRSPSGSISENLLPELKNLNIEKKEEVSHQKRGLKDETSSNDQQKGQGKKGINSMEELESWISLNDEMGHEIRYPFLECRSWNRMEFYIRRDFPHLDNIKRYHMKGPNSDIIAPGLWESTIQPGWTIRISLRPIAEEPKPQVSEWREWISRPSIQKYSNRNETPVASYTTYMYICCNCNDGPKLYNVQPRCIACNHSACGSCVSVK